MNCTDPFVCRWGEQILVDITKELQTPGIPAQADLKVPGTFSIASL